MAQSTDASQVLAALFAQYGLSSLASVVTGAIQANKSDAEVQVVLQNSQEFKDRFSGNEIRRQKGLPVLSVSDYLSREDSIDQQMHLAGLPDGFYNTQADKAALIGANVGAQELDQRLSAAKAVVTDGAMTGALAYAQQNYGLGAGDLMAYFLDPQRAAPMLTKIANSSQIGAAAKNTGFGDLNVATAERLDALGVTQAGATAGFGQAAGLSGLTSGVADTTSVNSDDLEKAVLEQNADAQKKVARAQADRQAQFQGGGTFASSNSGISGLGSAAS